MFQRQRPERVQGRTAVSSLSTVAYVQQGGHGGPPLRCDGSTLLQRAPAPGDKVRNTQHQGHYLNPNTVAIFALSSITGRISPVRDVSNPVTPGPCPEMYESPWAMMPMETAPL